MAKVSEEQLYELYDDMINQAYPEIKIGYITLDPARVLKECDPIAYRVGFNDWLDGEDNCEDCDNNPIDCTCEAE